MLRKCLVVFNIEAYHQHLITVWILKPLLRYFQTGIVQTTKRPDPANIDKPSEGKKVLFFSEILALSVLQLTHQPLTFLSLYPHIGICTLVRLSRDFYLSLVPPDVKKGLYGGNSLR